MGGGWKERKGRGWTLPPCKSSCGWPLSALSSVSQTRVLIRAGTAVFVSKCDFNACRSDVLQRCSSYSKPMVEGVMAVFVVIDWKSHFCCFWRRWMFSGLHRIQSNSMSQLSLAIDIQNTTDDDAAMNATSSLTFDTWTACNWVTDWLTINSQQWCAVYSWTTYSACTR